MSEILLAIIGDLEVERRKLLGQLDAAHARIAELVAQQPDQGLREKEDPR